jgi:GMP synthase (glutamine-hydrolysing)
VLYIIQLDPEVPVGNLVDYINIPHHTCQLHSGEQLPQIGQISAMIVLGGAMGANDDERYPFLTGLKKLIRAVSRLIMKNFLDSWHRPDSSAGKER